MLHRPLFITFFMALALSLAGCGGMDDSVSPYKKLDSNNPGGSKDPNGNDGSGGDKPSDGSGGDNNSGGENPSTGTTDPIPNCPASTTVFNNTRLGNTHNSADYDLNSYSAAADNGSIAGTWVFTLQDNFTTPEATGTTLQKFIMVIDGAGSAYQVGNCAGVTPVTLTKKCTTISGNKEVPCDTEGSNVFATVRTYAPWQSKVAATLSAEQSIQLPLLGLGFSETINPNEQYATLIVDSNSSMHSADNRIVGKKIATSTASLGKSQFQTTGHLGGASPVWCVLQAQESKQNCSVSSSVTTDDKGIPSTHYTVTPTNSSQILLVRASAEDGMQQVLTVADNNNPTGLDKFRISKIYVVAGDDTKSASGFFAMASEPSAPTNSQSMDLHQIKVQLVSGSDSLKLDTENFNAARP